MIEKQGYISVIVPVYNVELCLDKCINSIVCQTYEKLEIILVDDGSTDSSSNICDDWAKKDKRIKVIHKNNAGQSDARNIGIDAAEGEYILFIDSDDYVAVDMCEQLLNAMKYNDSDIAICSFYWQCLNRRKKHNMYFPSCGYLTRDNVLEFWAKSSSTEYIVPWNKLYRKKLFFTLEHIRYPMGRIYEDEYTTYRLLYNARKIIFVDKPLYFYVQRDGSTMSNFTMRNLLDRVYLVDGYFEWTSKYAPTKRKVMESVAMRSSLETLKQFFMHDKLKSERKICDDLMKHIDQEVHGYIYSPFATNRDKIKYILFRIGLYKTVIKFWGLYKKNIIQV